MTGWTSSADLVAKVRRRWDDSTLLRAYAAGNPFPTLRIPVRGPKAAELGDRFSEAQAWVEALRKGARDGRHYVLEYDAVGGRLVGRNQLPVRAVVDSYDQAWALLGVGADVRRFDAIHEQTAAAAPVHRWVCAQPFRALDQPDVWPQLVATHDWLNHHRGSGLRLRQIGVPGVDTKFVERHRAVLAAMLGVSASAAGFAGGLGLATMPETVRLRFDKGFAGLPASLSEATFRRDELARVRVSVRSALIVENEATYLSVGVPPEGVVIWGKGFEVDRAGSLPWLRDAEVTYWGDLDTHGFAILDRLRAWLPHTTSVLMDRETLLAHQDRWVIEERPTRARLARLDPEELATYDDLVSDRLGDRVRLEQERVAWPWAVERLGITQPE